MKRILSTALIAISVLSSPIFAMAQGGNRTVPAGDSLDQTPPVDVTHREMKVAPAQDKTPAKIQELKQEPGVVPPHP